VNAARPTVVVLGSFLEREYFGLWQRQQEFTAQLCARANVLFVERAAAGRITPARIVARLRRMASRSESDEWRPPVPVPAFVAWRQVPVGGDLAFASSARRAWRAVERAVAERGWDAPSLVCVGTPGEVWASLLEQVGLPFWYDMWERFLKSPAYDRVSRTSMTWLARHAALVTADTEVSRDDWAGVRSDILVVPHGAKEWAEAPRPDVSREALYYVGSVNEALDTDLMGEIARSSGWPVRIVGSDAAGVLDSVEVLGWRPSGAIPRVLSDAVAGLVPYRMNDFTAGVYPTKVYDYLLAGAPVLAAPLPALEGMPGVTVCRTADEYRAGADAASRLTEADRAGLREWALGQGWSTRFAMVARELAARGVAPEVWQ